MDQVFETAGQLAKPLEASPAQSPFGMFQETLRKLEIQLPEDVQEVCRAGIQIMEKSRDITHDWSHLSRMLEDFSALWLKLSLSDKTQIDTSEFFLSWAWHDVYRAKLSDWPHGLILGYLYDGDPSSDLFLRYCGNTTLTSDLVARTALAITQHDEKIFPKNASPASHLLYQLDCLDEWALQRLARYLGATRVEDVKLPKWKYVLLDFYLTHRMLPRTDKIYSYNYLRSEYVDRRRAFISQVEAYRFLYVK